jgi:hypothetical protein
MAIPERRGENAVISQIPQLADTFLIVRIYWRELYLLPNQKGKGEKRNRPISHYKRKVKSGILKLTKTY